MIEKDGATSQNPVSVTKKWKKMEVRIISGRDPDERPGHLDRDRRYVSSAKAEKKFAQVKELVANETVWGRPVVREWKKGDLRRLYWNDGSYLFVDATGAVRTSGGEASRAKFKHGLI
jgi:hypothetical protein